MTTSELHRPAVQDQAHRDEAVGGGRPFAWLLIITGAVGLVAAFTLSIEKIKSLENPNYVPSCSINPIISCGSVMKTWQEAAFGFPNMFLGLAGYAAITTIGVALLAGARFQRWFWLGVEAGVLFGIGFIHWLIGQTLYSIGALCPYCMGAWAATIPMFIYVTLHNLRNGVIPLPPRGRRALAGVLEFHWVLPFLWYLVIAMLVLTRFWYYWKTLI